MPALRNPKCSTKPRPPAEPISSEMSWREIPKLPGNGVLKDLLLDQLINSEETASDQKQFAQKLLSTF